MRSDPCVFVEEAERFMSELRFPNLGIGPRAPRRLRWVQDRTGQMRRERVKLRFKGNDEVTTPSKVRIPVLKFLFIPL